MKDLDETLRQLVAEACTHPPKSVDRQRALQEIYRLVMKSGKLWREYTPYYADALQQMWEYCCQHLEEYDPTLSGVITWLDNYLKKQLRLFRDRRSRDYKRRAGVEQTEQGNFVDPVDRLPARPELEPTLDVWEKTMNWVQTDPQGILQATCFRKRADINAQTLFLMRFPSETSWQVIADRFHLTPAEAKDLPKFYNRRCLPLLRNFGISQGYLDEEESSHR
ncbi:sigma-70 family RNA polymerase sigma factor [Leptolyngbya sp. FACHB-541]|uniref:sigma-70 family RNA polymerase sigma factor n=1 Tax=Leptolyngbya sp. FACHB-541 TaxID=2692810 RepID=UPI001687E51C|nr:sigma-70 family RNA polymerase sigma factor [Leptolyngbya sp. FACHB-541]MBD2000298.1 sigma-70 family RNA polymerase sigma factor [Leptolyngbya sp. FACHB-541]